jgi:hypothetical protein
VDIMTSKHWRRNPGRTNNQTGQLSQKITTKASEARRGSITPEREGGDWSWVGEDSDEIGGELTGKLHSRVGHVEQITSPPPRSWPCIFLIFEV